MGNSAGASQEIIAVPKGGGAQKGIGEKFSPDLFTGTGNFTVPIAVPAGRNGFQPELNLVYSTGSGNGPFGLGWTLSVPGVSRLTSKGIPRYAAAPADQPDTFVLSGSEDLVEVETDSGVASYRPRTEGLFAKITHHVGAPITGPATDHWEVRTKDGLTSVYGTPNCLDDDPAAIADPADPQRIFAWRLTETRNPFSDRITYEYVRDRAQERARSWNQLYLRRIRYVDLDGPDDADFLISIEFLYDDDEDPLGIAPESQKSLRQDAFSDYRAGFEIRTRRRCKWIVVRTHPAKSESRLVRAYEVVYLDERDFPVEALPLNGVSLLSRVNVIGFDDRGVGHSELPPLDFNYSRFTPQGRKFIPLQGRDLPATSLNNPHLELVDLFGQGLPDIVELGGAVRYWRNLGNGRFDMPRPFAEAPSTWRLSDVGVQMLDANGDGRADLLVTSGGMAGYYPLDFRGRFSPRSFQRYLQAPSFNLEDPEVRLIDLTGDGVTDVLRSGTSFECFFNHPTRGWLPKKTTRVQRQQSEAFPDVSFSDPRVKFADLSGDGLQDIAVVYQRRIDYWPNLGYGRWGARVATQIPQGLADHFDPQHVLLGDVDGDGLADLIYVSDREVTLWINRAGNGWSPPITIRGTPAVNTMVSVRLTDLMGTGVPGVLWTRDADGSGRPQSFFLDFTGGRKPYLLDRMVNNLGAVTEVTYTSSTQFYLRDEVSPSTRWRTTLPFPVQAVERVVVRDELSGGTLTTEYRYHHGYWDGVEREFRGFGMVEQLDTEVFDGYAGRGVGGNRDTLQRLLQQQSFSAPILTRTWFHHGPVDPADDTPWRELGWSDEYWAGDPNLLRHTESIDAFLEALPREARRDSLRTLRGSVLRSEVYALDGSPLQDRPYTVTENAYAMREEAIPMSPVNRKRIFFPHSTAQRTTQWERGNDPLTQFSFSGDYDDVGRPCRQVTIACPRGWRALADTPAAGFLATLAVTTYAQPDTEGPYLRDRIARIRNYEIAQTGNEALGTVASVVEEDAHPKRLIAELHNYYDGDAFTGLPSGQLGSYGVIVRSESLVLSEDTLNTCYGDSRPPYLDPASPFTGGGDYPGAFAEALPKLAGYVFRDGGEGSARSRGWYAISSSSRYDFHEPAQAARPHGLLMAQRDPLGHETRIDEYLYSLLPKKVTGPTGLTTEAEYDLRVLQPRSVRDPNGNVTDLAFSPIGLVVQTWVRGKPAKNQGDVQQPSVQMDYGLRAFYESKRADPTNPQPAYVRTIRRVFHDSDADDTGETIESREYSDGFGRLLQTRTQGEAVRFGDERFGNGVLSADQASGAGSPVVGVENNDASSPYVTVSGWQVYDKKGRVVEKYEPFFDRGWSYVLPEGAQFGKKVAMSYDPRGQTVRTVNPDGSEQRVIYGRPRDLADPPLSPLDAAKFEPTPWETYTYDPNDNAGRTHSGAEPHTGYRHHHNTPSSIEIDALGRTIRTVARHRMAPDSTSTLPPIEEHVTRTDYDVQGNILRIHDALGRTAFEYFYDHANRPLRTESVDAGSKRVAIDAGGNLVEQRDAKGALVLRSYDDLNRLTHLWARDAAGESITLREQLIYDRNPADPDNAAEHNLLGKLYQHFDEAGLVSVADHDFKGNIVESSRRVLSDDYLLDNIRNHSGSEWTLQVPRVAWGLPRDTLLDATEYRSRTAFDALNRVKWSEYPQAANGERHRLRPDYNRAGALESVVLEGPLAANGEGPHQTYVRRIAYNAKGQRTLVAYGNGLMTRYAYDEDTFRLARLRTERFRATSPGPLTYQPEGIPLQDIAYSYDLAGNILGMEDRTPGCGIAGNPEAQFHEAPLRELLNEGNDLLRRFEYDPLYRLVSATGRECKDIPSPRPWSDDASCGFNGGNHGVPNQDNAPHLTALYREEYAYDAAGNMLTLRHSQSVQRNGGAGWEILWSRQFGMGGRSPGDWRREATEHLTGEWVDAPSNRLTHVEEHVSGAPTPPSVPQTHFYDASGNMTREHTERHFEWDHADRMKAFRNQVDTGKPTIYAVYLYDASGQRVKKLVVKGNHYRTTTYLGSAFEHHTDQNLDGTQKAENCTLHVLDDKSRIAIVRVGAAFEGDGAAAHPAQYHLGDHLGSSGLVVSAAGEWINREEFFPYGETSFGSFGRKRYRFTGKERDEESGLSYHAARYYGPWLVRWISGDPTGIEDGANLYRYVASNPITRVDSSGLSGSQVPGVSHEFTITVTGEHSEALGVCRMTEIAVTDTITETIGPGGGLESEAPLIGSPETGWSRVSQQSDSARLLPAEPSVGQTITDTLRKIPEMMSKTSKEREAEVAAVFKRSGASPEQAQQRAAQYMQDSRQIGEMVGGMLAGVAGKLAAVPWLRKPTIRDYNRAGKANEELLQKGLEKLGVTTGREKVVRDAAGKVLRPQRRLDLTPRDVEGRVHPIELTTPRACFEHAQVGTTGERPSS